MPLAWKQFRALGSAALALCDVAAGHLDGYLDGHADQHAPWDYLGGMLVCQEAGALVVDAGGRDLVGRSTPSVRRQLVAAGTAELLADAAATGSAAVTDSTSTSTRCSTPRAAAADAGAAIVLDAFGGAQQRARRRARATG